MTEVANEWSASCVRQLCSSYHTADEEGTVQAETATQQQRRSVCRVGMYGTSSSSSSSSRQSATKHDNVVRGTHIC